MVAAVVASVGPVSGVLPLTLIRRVARCGGGGGSRVVAARFAVCVANCGRRGRGEVAVRARSEAGGEGGLEPGDGGGGAVEGRMERKRRERRAYLAAAVASSVGITSAVTSAVYFRFYNQAESGGSVSVMEMLGMLSLTAGAIVGMEMWARWAHRDVWHAWLWGMHESHHRPRQGALELNDVFAIINAVPAIALLAYGSFNRHLVAGLCFGAGLGITVYGMAYMFVHDGLVHRRFPVGPIANVPYLRRVAAAHQIHHSGKFNGVPYGLFLGPEELEEIGGEEELNRELNRGRRRMDNSQSIE